jgi:hypothetical protein
VLALLGLLAIPVVHGAAGQPDPWIGKTPTLSVRRLAVDSGRVTLEYPAKGWKVLPAGGQTIATLAESDGRALVQLERVRLNLPLEADEVTSLFAELEARSIAEQHPDASGFVSRVSTSGARRVVIVQYSRPGAAGVELVRQYSIPVGDRLYRLVCAAPAVHFTKFERAFAHMAASLSFGGSE